MTELLTITNEVASLAFFSFFSIQVKSRFVMGRERDCNITAVSASAIKPYFLAMVIVTTPKNGVLFA